MAEQQKSVVLESQNAKSNFGKWGWIFVAFHITSYFLQTGMIADGQNIVAPAVSEMTGIEYSSILSVATPCALIALLGYLLMGQISKKVPVSKMFGGCLILLGLSYILMCNAKSVFMYGAGMCLCMIFANGAAYVSGGRIVANWFPKKKDLVCGYSTAGCNLGSALYIPILSFMVGAYGLSHGTLVFSVVSVIAGILAMILIKDTPGERGVYPDNVSKEVFEREYSAIREVSEEDHEWTTKKILTSPIFWIAGLVVGLQMMGTTGIMTQLVVRNMELGMSQNKAIFMMSAIAVIGVFGSWAWGILGQKTGTVKSIQIFLVWYGLGVAFNLMGTSWSVYASVFMIGVAVGASANFVIALPTSIWGSQEFKYVWPLFYLLYSSITAWYGIVNGTAIKLIGSLRGAYFFFIILFVIDLFLTRFVKDGMFNPDYKKEQELLNSNQYS